MNKLIKVLTATLIILTCAAWSTREQACNNCDSADQILIKVLETQKAFLRKEKDMKDNNVIFGPTNERKDFELAQGEAYRFVCDDDKNSLNPMEKKALIRFVFAMNNLDIESEAIHDLNGCFRRKVLRTRSAYAMAADSLGKKDLLKQFLIDNRPTYQDQTR